MSLQRVILTTGGTGGHIFPALAVAEALRQRYPGLEAVFVGSLYGPEREWAAKAGLEFVGLPVRGFLGRGFKAVSAGMGMARALWQAMGLMRRFKPQVVAGFGGYAAFAPVMAASLCAIPTAIHEQNAVAGVSNKVLSRFARKVYLSMPGTAGFAAHKCVLTGNPVREAVVRVGEQEHDFGGKRLLIVGGSQGAKALNDCVLKNLPHLREAGVSLRHQTGPKDHARVAAAYAEAGWDNSCAVPFIADMAHAYHWADLVLCRSGASTVTELAAAGRGAVLVPFPFATHDHQTYNARLLAEDGAALLAPESTLHSADVMGKVVELLKNVDILRQMADRAKAQAKPGAAARLAEELALLSENTKGNIHAS